MARIPTTDRLGCVMIGLAGCQLAGVATLALLVGGIPVINSSPYVVLAGLLTFPVATGFYYRAGIAFGTHLEVAAQFAKVKPLLTIGFAYYLLGESTETWSIAAITLLSAGVSTMLFATWRGAISWPALAYGLGTASAWSLGEVAMALGMAGGQALPDTFSALFWGTALSLPVLAWRGRRHLQVMALRQPWFYPFLLHGVLSFGCAYLLYFKSIDSIGLGRTALINAFWPVGSMVIASAVAWARNVDPGIPPLAWLAASFLLCGSVFQALHYG